MDIFPNHQDGGIAKSQPDGSRCSQCTNDKMRGDKMREMNQACYEDTRGYTSNTVLELRFCPKRGNTQRYQFHPTSMWK